MRITKILAITLALAVLPSCDLDVPDLNNPGINQLEDNPTPSAVSAACTGLIIGNRRNHANGNGYVLQLGMLGREAYNFDGADPRYFSELVNGILDAGSPFGGNFWALPYSNIRLAYTILNALDKVAEFSDAEKSSIRGFAKTFIALDLLEVINAHDDIGAVIDVNHPIDAPLGAIVDKPAVFMEIDRLLDEAAMDLAGASMKFPFKLSAGFTGFDKPETFRKFNRAMRARVAIYQKDYAKALSALSESFINDMAMSQADLDVGVYYTYSTGAGDVTNGLTNPNIYVHPSIKTDAMMNGATIDKRFTAKVAMAMKPGQGGGSTPATSDLQFTMYADPTAPVTMIDNEELLLIRAEAKFFTSDVAGALADLNIVRTIAGGLQPITVTPNEMTFVTELLYEREFSLLFEGHRWIDMRRFGRLDDLPHAADKPVNKRYPLPLAECNARPNEPKCMLGST